MISLVKQMYMQFGINYEGAPRSLPKADFEFHLKAFQEEIEEYMEAWAIDDLEGQMDALIDLQVFILSAAERSGFMKIEEGFKRVMIANMQKQVVANASESKRGHGIDLKKPAGWRAPYLQDLLEPPKPYRGIIVLEGPDASGKTTLAEHLVKNYGAHYMHCTWTPEIDKRMQSYMEDAWMQANYIAMNQLVVLDRHFISEIVYADCFREGSKLTHINVFAPENCEADIHYLLCLPTDYEAWLNTFQGKVEAGGELYNTNDGIYKRYQELFFGETLKGYGPTDWKYYNPWLQVTSSLGGLISYPRATHYDWMNEQHDLDSFLRPILKSFYHDEDGF